MNDATSRSWFDDLVDRYSDRFKDFLLDFDIPLDFGFDDASYSSPPEELPHWHSPSRLDESQYPAEGPPLGEVWAARYRLMVLTPAALPDPAESVEDD
jgi:hypothetical protein